MKKTTTFVLGACLVIAVSSPGLLGQTRQRQATINPGPARPPLTRDQREDVRDRREDIRDRREDVRDRREDVRDRLEDRIDRNPRFASRLRDLIPSGTSARDAISGFKNEGQFLAALHASKNLSIPFDELKGKVTGDGSIPLGEALHSLRPDLSDSAIRDAIRRAEREAQDTEKTAEAAD